MLGIYFSGTGNTKYCLEKFLKYYGGSELFSIENPELISELKEFEEIVLAYPIYYSNIPKIVRDFIKENKDDFKNKRVFIIATMGLFSGDGAGCGARLLKKYGGIITGGLHLRMPDCIGDVKLQKKSLEENKQIVINAEKKIEVAVKELKVGNHSKEGLSIFHHIVGLFGQRLWFYNKTQEYSDKLKINSSFCIGCRKCVDICPMQNIFITNEKASARSMCTMCYRCINNCPQKAITLLGDEVIEQCFIENYINTDK
ncbi:MAG: EFR1 family ferrodoxin [Methanobrevibacter sp.]|nr:EFR1 family ferrodoxin [Methanobrevibacter sp.]